MRKTIITLVIIALVWIGYIAWPLYELAVIVRAIDDRDLATVARHVNFDRVRVSLTEQVVAAYMRRSGIKPNLLAEQAVAGLSILNPVVNKLVSPEALSDLLAVGWPVAVAQTLRQVLSELTRGHSEPLGRSLVRLTMASADSKCQRRPKNT